MRVCKYEVIGEITDGRKEWEKPVYVDEDYDYDSDWDEEYYEDEDDGEGWNDELEVDALAMLAYIENRHAEDIVNSKQVQSRMKGVSLSSQDIIEIAEDLDSMRHILDGKQGSRSEISG